MITHCVFCQKGTFHCPSWHLKTASLFYWAREGEDHQEKVPWKHMVSLERKPNCSSCTPILPPPSPSTFTTHTHESDWKLDTVSSWQIPSNLAVDSANTPTPKPHPTTPLALPPPTSQPHTPEPSNLLADLKEWGKQIEWSLQEEREYENLLEAIRGGKNSTLEWQLNDEATWMEEYRKYNPCNHIFQELPDLKRLIQEMKSDSKEALDLRMWTTLTITTQAAYPKALHLTPPISALCPGILNAQIHLILDISQGCSFQDQGGIKC